MAYASMLAPVSFALVLSLAVAASAQDPPTVAPTSGPWDAGAGFKFEKREKKTRQALSGIACPANTSGQRRCLAVFDEGTEARYLVITDKAYAVDNERVILIQGDVELDGEGAATDGRFYYVTGSHSVKRKTCANNAASRQVIRLEIDPRTGRALRDSAGKLSGHKVTGTLWNIMRAEPGLKDYVGDNMCLGTEPPPDDDRLTGKRGVNIEGLAVKDGRLLFGFRGPAIGGIAKILSVDAKALFEGGNTDPKLSSITVGKGRAVRDLHAVSDGILVLAGPDDDKANENVGWLVARIDSQDIGKSDVNPKHLARLDVSKVTIRGCDKELKPEALAVIGDEPGRPYQVVIFSDGMCDGGPLGFTIPR